MELVPIRIALYQLNYIPSPSLLEHNQIILELVWRSLSQILLS